MACRKANISEPDDEAELSAHLRTCAAHDVVATSSLVPSETQAARMHEVIPGSFGLNMRKHAKALPVGLGYVLCSSLMMVMNKQALQARNIT